MGLSLPVVVRLEGTNVELGKQILRDSKLAITPADGLADGARKAVEATR
jgi:succinyl-CoA synthetase beta subunit